MCFIFKNVDSEYTIIPIKHRIHNPNINSKQKIALLEKYIACRFNAINSKHYVSALNKLNEVLSSKCSLSLIVLFIE